MTLVLRVKVRDDAALAICERLRKPGVVGRRPAVRKLLTATLRAACERELKALTPDVMPGYESADEMMANKLGAK